ncbi:MAG: hypothetical protein HZB16_12145 [Armatimonadetes bacterium]|nr:hypothetical protein [Armatimonadota bacterium]
MTGLTPYCAVLCLLAGPARAAAEPQFLVLNLTPGHAWHQSRPDTLAPDHLAELRAKLPFDHRGPIRLATSYIFSYLNSASDATFDDALRRCLATAVETDTPILIALDGENWWDARPDLWNWWDPAKPGYNPENARNVEWTGPGPEHAVKLAWRNWGRQLRVCPPPNLMSPRYRAACAEQMRRIVPIIAAWSQALPAARRDLFVGIKLGWESSIGVNAWHYPGGNDLLDRDPKDDPQTGLNTDLLPSRGVATLGYAAVATAGLRTDGQVTEADQAEVVRRHLADLCRQARELGLPRDKVFTHGVGWKRDELLYRAAVNADSCPGWSSYHHAADPARDPGVQSGLAQSDAPGWAVAEWLLGGPLQIEPWHRAMEATFAEPKCRYLCVYNWESIRTAEPVLEAIRQLVTAPR